MSDFEEQIIPSWLHSDISKPVSPPLETLDGVLATNRNPRALRAIVDMFRVESAERYRVRILKGLKFASTFCNIFTSDVTRALGAEIFHNIEGKWQSANDNLRWLRAGGGGYRKVTGNAAQAAADAGQVAIVACDGDGHGHIAIMVPSEEKVGLWIAQAGARNYRRAPLVVGFGNRVSEVEFFTHA